MKKSQDVVCMGIFPRLQRGPSGHLFPPILLGSTHVKICLPLVGPKIPGNGKVMHICRTRRCFYQWQDSFSWCWNISIQPLLEIIERPNGMIKFFLPFISFRRVHLAPWFGGFLAQAWDCWSTSPWCDWKYWNSPFNSQCQLEKPNFKPPGSTCAPNHLGQPNRVAGALLPDFVFRPLLGVHRSAGQSWLYQNMASWWHLEGLNIWRFPKIGGTPKSSKSWLTILRLKQASNHQRAELPSNGRRCFQGPCGPMDPGCRKNGDLPTTTKMTKKGQKRLWEKGSTAPGQHRPATSNSAAGKKCRAGSQIWQRHLVVLLQILCLSRYHVHMGVGP